MNWLAFFNIQKPENIKAVLAILKTESEQALAESEAWLSANGIVADVDPTADKDP
jgi:hypothetical protein